MPVYKQPNSNNWLIEFMVDGQRYLAAAFRLYRPRQREPIVFHLCAQ